MESNPVLIIRADASSLIGNGHVTRCCTLAGEWRGQGGTVGFVTLKPDKVVADQIAAAGAELIALQEAEDEVEKLQTLIGEGADWVCFDGYELAEATAERIGQTGVRRLWIEDRQGHPIGEANVLVNQNVGADHRDDLGSRVPLRLLGPRFSLVRPEFQPTEQERSGPLRILVTFGGADPDNVTRRVLETLAGLDLDLQIVTLVGPLNRHLEKLQELERPGLSFLLNPRNLAAQMAWGDLAIAAGGTTCLELARMGLPMLLVTQADNQFQNAEGLQESGAALWVGDARQFPERELRESLRLLAASPKRRAQMASSARMLVDGQGARRVVSIMRSLSDGLPPVKSLLRRAVPEDVFELWRLANDPGVRSNSFDSNYIPLDDHKRWFASRLSSPDDVLFVLDWQGAVAAQIRYSRVKEGWAEVHLAVNPAFRGRGLATGALRETRPHALAALNLRGIRGLVLPTNGASLKAFDRAGYSRTEPRVVRHQPCVVFEWQPT